MHCRCSEDCLGPVQHRAGEHLASVLRNQNQVIDESVNGVGIAVEGLRVGHEPSIVGMVRVYRYRLGPTRAQDAALRETLDVCASCTTPGDGRECVAASRGRPGLPPGERRQDQGATEAIPRPIRTEIKARQKVHRDSERGRAYRKRYADAYYASRPTECDCSSTAPSFARRSVASRSTRIFGRS